MNNERLLVSRNKREGWYFGVRWSETEWSEIKNEWIPVGKRTDGRSPRWLSLRGFFGLGRSR